MRGCKRLKNINAVSGKLGERQSDPGQSVVDGRLRGAASVHASVGTKAHGLLRMLSHRVAAIVISLIWMATSGEASPAEPSARAQARETLATIEQAAS